MDQKSKKEATTDANKIIGRSSDITISNRKEICIALRKINPTMSIHEFIEILKNEYKKNNINIPSDQTIKSDFKKWGISFKKPSKIISERTSFHMLGTEIRQKLRQIRVSYKMNSIVLFDCENLPKISYDRFRDIRFLYENKKAFLSKLSDFEQAKSDNEDLFQLSIILKEKGLGEYIANIFDSNFISPKPFLYSEVHDYCTIIVFEPKNYEEIMDSTYRIVEEYLIPSSK